MPIAYRKDGSKNKERSSLFTAEHLGTSESKVLNASILFAPPPPVLFSFPQEGLLCSASPETHIP